MNREKTKEEYLEALWYLEERNSDSLDDFSAEVGEEVSGKLIGELESEGLISAGGKSISLTSKGRDFTRKLIRSHRIAERLVHDVLGVEFETGACEFEHIVNPDLVDSICTLLGHPRECPHGMPIPEGNCCRLHSRFVASSVVPLDQLAVGQSAKIAYVYAANDQQLHRLENLLIRPGVTVKLHQRYPSFVIECENSSIALDEHVAAAIQVWITDENKQRIRPHGNRTGGRRSGRHRGRHGQPADE